ncbi:MAG: HAMP domain-containing histidine kinase [Planctomycetaceae bacterium]|nr:HAMP domain-containing histidine kinase [Planctomycetaceae bacterium]
MIKLFVQFLLGLISLIVLASLFQSWVAYQSNVENEVAWTKFLGVCVEQAASDLESLEVEERSAAFERIREEYGINIRIVSTSLDETNWMLEYLEKPNSVRYVADEEMGCLLDGGANVLLASPVMRFQNPNKTLFVLAVIGYILITVIIVGFLIRPISIQFQSITRAARAISAGNLSARITGPAVKYRDPAVTAFNLMASRTEKLVKTKIELLQMVSHEIRTPLSRIHFAVELFESAATPEERSERIAAIVDSADDLDRLVNELLKYVRSGESGVEKEPVGISDLLFDFDRASMESGKNISVQLENDAVVQCDRVLLKSAIGNLIGNAFRFAKTEVLVSSVLEGDTVLLHIEDDGPGVPEANYESIFEPFFRLDSPGAEHKHGVGLGLAIVKRAVERCGGEVGVSKSPMGGARFTLRLPILKK